jgi:primary-amine oxidase
VCAPPAEPSARCRMAAFVILAGKSVIEGTVDLAARSLTPWKPMEGAHGMVLIDDCATVQAAIEARSDCAKALARCAASAT